MSEPTTALQDPSAADRATDRSIARGERLLRGFEELTERGMKRLRALDSAPYEFGQTPDPIKTFATASRAVRVSLICEARIDRELRNLKDGPVSATPKGRDNPGAERWLQLLEEVGEIGLRLLRAHESAPCERDENGAVVDTTEGFATLSRAIRLTLMLEARTDRDLRDLKAGVVAPSKTVSPAAERRDAAAAAERLETVRNRLADAINEYAESEESFDELLESLNKRLEGDRESYGADRPLRETVERLCRELDLEPDWSRWLDDEEDWIYECVPLKRDLLTYHEHLPHHKPRGQFNLAADSEFKATLRKWVSEAIDTYAVSEVHFDNLCEELGECLEHDEPYMNGEIPLRNAVWRVCSNLRLMPDACRWQGEGWVNDGARCRGPAPPHNLE